MCEHISRGAYRSVKGLDYRPVKVVCDSDEYGEHACKHQYAKPYEEVVFYLQYVGKNGRCVLKAFELLHIVESSACAAFLLLGTLKLLKVLFLFFLRVKHEVFHLFAAVPFKEVALLLVACVVGQLVFVELVCSCADLSCQAVSNIAEALPADGLSLGSCRWGTSACPVGDEVCVQLVISLGVVCGDSVLSCHIIESLKHLIYRPSALCRNSILPVGRPFCLTLGELALYILGSKALTVLEKACCIRDLRLFDLGELVRLVGESLVYIIEYLAEICILFIIRVIIIVFIGCEGQLALCLFGRSELTAL